MNIDLRKGDCLEVMDKLIEEGVRVDAIITSPPYNKAGYEGFIRKRHSTDSWGQRNVDYGEDSNNDFMKESAYQEWQINFLNKCAKILKEDGSVFYNHKVRVAKHKASHPIEWILKSDLIFRQQLVWDRKSSPAVSPIRYLPSTELIFWLTKNQSQPSFNRSKELSHKGEVWQISAKPQKNHPAPFPIELVENILPNLRKDAIILDPFMGIGTTGIACKNMDMDFIGIELDEEYFNMASDRIHKEDDLTLF